MSERKALEIEDRERISAANDLYSSGKYTEAFDIYYQLAQRDFTDCKRFIGWMYFCGEGVPKDDQQASHWLKAAAADNDAEAQFGVGRVYTKLTDYESALTWYEKSAANDFLPSIYRIARMHRYGHGVPTDTKEALRLFKHAAQKGHLKSARDYAVMLIKGYDGVGGIIKGLLLFPKVVINTVFLAIRDSRDPRFMY